VAGKITATRELIRLVAAEQDCCQFFKFAITVDSRGVALEVRAPGDARSIVESMFGVAAWAPSRGSRQSAESVSELAAQAS
jgi:hypothetical protein